MSAARVHADSSSNPPPSRGGSTRIATAMRVGVGGLFRLLSKFTPHPRPLPATRKSARGEGSRSAVPSSLTSKVMASVLLLLVLGLAAPAAALDFPALTGRVVDQAN